MAIRIWVHTPEKTCIVRICIEVVWVRYKGRGPVTTRGHVEGPLRDTPAPAVAPVVAVDRTIVQKSLTEFEPVSYHAVHLHVFGILECYRPEGNNSQFALGNHSKTVTCKEATALGLHLISFLFMASSARLPCKRDVLFVLAPYDVVL
jgi:hypothetical protein